MKLDNFIEAVNSSLGNCVFTIDMYRLATEVVWNERTAVLHKVEGFEPMDVANVIRSLASHDT